MNVLQFLENVHAKHMKNKELLPGAIAFTMIERKRIKELREGGDVLKMLKRVKNILERR